MYIGDQLFHSPFLMEGGDPNCYDVDWRHQAAVYVAEQGKRAEKKLPAMLKDDPQFFEMVEYVKAMNRVRPGTTRQLHQTFGLVHTVSRWVTDDYYERKFHGKINSLLLSPFQLPAICGYCALPPECVQVYEKFYFNVRTEDCDKTRNELMRQIVALGGLEQLPQNAPATMRWMMAAAQPMGHVLLAAQLGLSLHDNAGSAMERFQTLQDQGLSYLAQLMVAGRADQETVIALIGQGQEQQKFEASLEQATGVGAVWDAFEQLLRLARPHLAARVKGEAADKATNAALQARWQSERVIEATEVEDAGPGAGVMGLNAQLHQQARRADAPAKRKRGEKP